MRFLRPSAGQAVFHDFIVAPDTCAPAQRLHAGFIVEGILDMDRLRRAIRHAVATHESLRTSMETIDGHAAQVIREMSELSETPWTTVEWDGSPESTHQAIRDLDDWWTVPRELSVRVVIGCSPKGRTLVLCVFNHAFGDGMSASIVVDLITREYVDPSDAADPERTAQFSDYYEAMLQDGADTSEDWQRLINSSYPAVPQWMLDQKLAHHMAWTRVFEWGFAPATVRLLQDMGREHLCSPFEALAACIAIYFRREDGLPTRLGVIHSGRHRPRGTEVVGLLRSYLLDVVDLGGCADVRACVTARQRSLRHAAGHFARLPFEEACHRAEVRPGWRAGELAQWEVELNGMYEDTAGPGTIDGLPVEPTPVEFPEKDIYGESAGLFVLYFTFGRDRVVGTVRYVDPPVTRDLATRLASDVESVVAFAAADPTRRPTDAPAFFEAVGNGG